MINKEFVRSTNDSADDDFEELSIMNEKSRMEFYREKHGRKGSMSLPVSPKLERKHTTALDPNYFTVTKPPERTESNLSFLTNLFGITAAKQPADIASSTASNLVKNSELSNNASSRFASQTEPEGQPKRKMTPKANEYREMNIFSPTSM